MPVYLRITPRNLNSMTTLWAVLEAEIPAARLDVRLARHVDDLTEPGVVLYSFMTCDAPGAAGELERLRDRFGDRMLTMAGGPHACADPDGVIGLGFRWVVVGEAVPELGALVYSALSGQAPPPGVYRFGPLRDLDRYPPWPRAGTLFCPIEVTRGCPMRCAFCQTPVVFGRTPRHRSLESLRAAFRRAVETGHSYTRFVAPNAFGYGAPHGRRPNPAAIESLLTAARDEGFASVFFGTFPSEVRPESVRPDLLQVVRALCDNKHIAVGLQSGSDDMLRRMRRGHTVREGLAAVHAIAKAGFTPKVDFIFGLPGETPSDQARTADLIRHLHSSFGATIHAHRFTPLPGTPWARERPSPVSKALRDVIDELTGTGRMTGVHPEDFPGQT